jgi:tetratricopeptide (TPR) repeat protein
MHPVQTESVTYISGRSTSLMAFFYLGSILVYISFKKKIWLYFVSPLLFVMAMLVKETAVTLPFALLLWERNFKKQVVHWILLFFIVFAAIIHPNYGELLAYSFKTRSIWENLLSQINGVTYLISRLIAVWGLNIDPDLQSVSAWTPLLVVKLSLLLSCIFMGLIKRKHWLGFGTLWFFLHLVPTNSIVPRLDIANERQLYLSIWGVSLILGIGAERLLCQKFFWAGIIAISILLGYFTIVRNEVYKSEIALWTDTVKKSPEKPRAYNNLGYAYMLDRRYDEAEMAYLKALKLKPDYGIARNNLTTLKGLKADR